MKPEEHETSYQMIAPHIVLTSCFLICAPTFLFSSCSFSPHSLSITPRRCWWCQNPGWRSKSQVVPTSGQRTKTPPSLTDGMSFRWHSGSLCEAHVGPPLPLLGALVNKTRAVTSCPAKNQSSLVISTKAVSSPASGFLARCRCEQRIWGPHPSWWQEWTTWVPPPTGARTGDGSGISPEHKCQLCNHDVKTCLCFNAFPTIIYIIMECAVF